MSLGKGPYIGISWKSSDTSGIELIITPFIRMVAHIQYTQCDFYKLAV